MRSKETGEPATSRLQIRRGAEYALSESGAERLGNGRARPTGGFSDLQSSRAALDAAAAARDAAQKQIDVLKTQMEVTAASALMRIWHRQKRYRAAVDLRPHRTPCDGQRPHCQIDCGGRLIWLTPPQSVMVVVPLDVWVTANFKETQLAAMRIGQPVNISVEALMAAAFRATSSAFNPAAAPLSACCPRKTPPEITSRWCNACRSRSPSTGVPRSNWDRECRSCRR